MGLEAKGLEGCSAESGQPSQPDREILRNEEGK
jgi:hypothetical protein